MPTFAATGVITNVRYLKKKFASSSPDASIKMTIRKRIDKLTPIPIKRGVIVFLEKA